MYNVLKIVHIISACLLFGTGLGTAIYLLYAHLSKNISIIALSLKHIVKGDWYFTLTSGFVQLVTGLLMVYVNHLSLSLFWVWGSLIGYAIAGICWLPVVFLQIQLREIAVKAAKEQLPLPPLYYKRFYQWFWLGWPAFLSLFGVFYLMTARPSHFFLF